MNCPLTKEECPEHNKKGGCAWWLEAKQRDEATSTMQGCAMVLSPMLLANQINATYQVAKEANQTSCEISALRNENIKEQEASRAQLLSLALGKKELVQAEHSTLKIGN